MGEHFKKLPTELLALPIGEYSFNEACYLLDLLDRKVEMDKARQPEWSRDPPAWE